MEDIQAKKKIKGKKVAAIFLIFFPLSLLLSNLRKSNFEIISLYDYVSAGSLTVLIICGLVGLRNSLQEQKRLNNQT